MNDSDTARQEFLALRENSNSALLATLANDSRPEASYAPFVWYQGDCYLFLSELASHTGNLMRNAQLSLMLIEAESKTSNPFARRRINLQGKAQLVERDDPCFTTVLAVFHQQFGKVMKMIEPLPDFHLFRVLTSNGRFVRGFGQAYELTGKQLDRLDHIDPGRN